MKLLVIGLGSMGKRRLRLLHKLDTQHQLAGVDGQAGRRTEVEALGIPTFDTIEAAFSAFEPDAALICTSPLSHAVLIHTCLKHGVHVFSEINLVPDGYEENMALAKEQGVVLMLSSTFLYRKEISYIRDTVKKDASNALYTYHVGQYLPDWHPWESYKDYFIGDRRTNGCREILAINLPWLIAAFGPVERIHAERRKLTSLEVDYPDSYVVTLVHENGNLGVFTVDLVARDPICALRAESEHLLLSWQGKPESLQAFHTSDKQWRQVSLYDQIDHLSGYSANIVEDAYQAELAAFFAAMEGIAPPYGFEDDVAVLRLIDEIEAWA